MSGAFENAAFQLTGYQTDAETTTPPVGGAYGPKRTRATRPRRTRIYLDDRPLRLTDDEIESLIKRTLDQPAPEPVTKRDIAELPAAEQAYALAYPRYVSLRSQFLARENELALEKLREVALRLWLLE